MPNNIYRVNLCFYCVQISLSWEMMTMTLLFLEMMASVQRNKAAAVVFQSFKDSDEHTNSSFDCKTHICFKLLPVLDIEVRIIQMLSNMGEKGSDRC